MPVRYNVHITFDWGTSVSQYQLEADSIDKALQQCNSLGYEYVSVVIVATPVKVH